MKRVLLMTVAGILVASSAMAGMENARFALHAKAKFTSTKTIALTCDNASTITEEANYSPNFSNTPCTQYATNLPAAADYAEVYAMVGQAGIEGVAGVSFGISYNQAVDPTFIGWNLCSNGNEFPNAAPGRLDFPDQGGGTRITWLLPEGCQTEQIAPAGVHAVIGFFHIYRYDGLVMSLTPNNNLQSGIPELAITNCGGATTDLATLYPQQIYDLMLGKVGFGSGAGYIPCGIIPAAPTTWGKIKAQYTSDSTN